MDWTSLKFYTLLICGVFTISSAHNGNHSYFEEIRNYMDEAIHPCENFYEFSCGGYLNNPEVNYGSSMAATPLIENEKYMRHIIHHKVSDSDPQAFKFLKTYFDTCYNSGKIQNTTTNHFIGIIKELGGWPLLENFWGELPTYWNESSFNWIRLLNKLRKLGLPDDILMKFEIGKLSSNSSRRIIQINAPSSSLYDNQALVSHLNVSDIVKILNKVFLTAIGPKISIDPNGHDTDFLYFNKIFYDFASYVEKFGPVRGQPLIRIENVLLLEAQIVKCNVESERREVIFTIEKLTSIFPNIPWSDYIQDILGSHARLEPGELVLLTKPDYFKCLSDVISTKFNYDIINNIIMRSLLLLHSLATNLPAYRVERENYCYTDAISRLKIAANALYVRRTKPKFREKVLDLVETIRDSFRSFIKKVDWMTDETRDRALEKLKNIHPLIGFPDEYFDDHKINEYYKGLELDPDNYIANIRNLNKFVYSQQIDSLRELVNRTGWLNYDLKSYDTNSVYHGFTNTIEFPAGAIQSEMYMSGNRGFFNFGAIGSKIAHELGHGFDNIRLSFDKDGNYGRWWDNATHVTLNEKLKCFEKQYSDYKENITQLYINGDRTAGENIPDNIGFKVAHHAYKEWQKKHGREIMPKNWKYTAEQMFWIELGISWCEKKSNETLRHEILFDSHSPAEIRINGALSNLREFSEDFNCSADSKMNRQEKCELF